MTLDTGLSPHTRRNPGEERAVLVPSRSISAHAEEPCSSRSASAAVRVYLRTRGGTDDAGLYGCVLPGLSPHTRRNPTTPECSATRAWSISAHAEEPSSTARARRMPRVYLRTCGGTSSSRLPISPFQGLSPHTRRNLAGTVEPQQTAGSISAHAEEPSQATAESRPPRVYLRTRGGTPPTVPVPRGATGLSPHTRRNPPLPRPVTGDPGSISAHAEEPEASGGCG